MPLHSIVASVPALMQSGRERQQETLTSTNNAGDWTEFELSVFTFPCSITDKAIVLVRGLLDRITATRLAGGFGET